VIVAKSPVSWGHAIALIVGYSLVPIAANHGIGPIGIFLVLGWNDEWLLPVL
jgi:hypothetical protein